MEAAPAEQPWPQQQKQLMERSQLWHVAVPRHGQGQLHRAVCQGWLSPAAAVGLGAREDDSEGEGGRKSSL